MEKSRIFRKWGIFHKTYDAAGILNSFANHLEYSLSKDQYTATLRDAYVSLALAVRDRLVEQWIKTQQLYHEKDVKRVYYLSAEYLMGRALVNNLINLGIYEETRKAMSRIDLEIEELVDQEPDAGLGNGGLGRLAACFLDSMATLEIPATGYGIRYEFGIFEQEIRDLAQHELPDEWLKYGSPWEIERPEYSFTVKFYGKVEKSRWPDGSPRALWTGTDDVVGVAYDTPVAGYDNITVNTLRLWSAKATRDFDLEYFQHGDYLKAVERKSISENISKVLYPNDSTFEGRELRLKQQYFFVSCSMQDIIRRYLAGHSTFDELPDRAAVQLNDTHPSLAIPELMRLLVDEHMLDWEEAWDITVRTFAYTNHTLLPEALEEWSADLLGRLLPRHLQIIVEIDRRFLEDVSSRYPRESGLPARVSILAPGPESRVRMANLAVVGSHSTNGVAELHTDLLRRNVLSDFDRIFPGRINNKTNGITPRRWLLASNMDLAGLVTGCIGEGWKKDLEQIRRLEEHIDDPGFLDRFESIKRRNKEGLSRIAGELTGIRVDPGSIFDVHIKRFHEYKRQSLNILHVIYTWLRLKEDPSFEIHPRTFIFGGKAAPDYLISKLVIRLVNHAAERINGDSETSEALKVVFLPNYRVSLAEKVIPAADISEQISTAGYEASGTGNMKLALNGALTVGTLDGANIEILDAVGDENMFIFGMTAGEVRALQPDYSPKVFLERDPLLKKAIGLIADGFFSPGDKSLFRPLTDLLLDGDRFMVLADFESYRDAQERAGREYRDGGSWARKAAVNVCRCGRFSSDRTILEYNREIWKAKTVPVPRDGLKPYSGEPAFLDEGE